MDERMNRQGDRLMMQPIKGPWPRSNSLEQFMSI